MRTYLLATGLLTCVAAAAGQDPRAAFLADYALPPAVIDAHTGLAFRTETLRYAFPDGRLEAEGSAEEVSDRANKLVKNPGARFLPPGETKWLRFTPSVAGENPRYSFRLEGKPKTGEMVLRSLEVGPRELSSAFMNTPFGYSDVLTRSYKAIAADPSNEVLAYDDCEWAGRAAKRLRVRLAELKAFAAQKLVPDEREFFFAPSLQWVCTGTRYVPTANGAYRGASAYETVHSYDESDPRVPVLSHYEIFAVLKSPPGKRVKLGDTTVTEITRRRLDPAEFTLSAQGFPEPEGLPAPVVEPRRFPWWAVLAIAVGCSVAVAVTLRRRSAMKAPA